MKRPDRVPFAGPALFSYGFRPFFLFAALFAVAAIPIWVSAWLGYLTFNPAFPVRDWHIHEMLFGYSSAVICGFLFTAIPNWTGRLPIQGWPLAMLGGLWLLGRLVMASGAGPASTVGVMVVDGAFLPAVAVMAMAEIFAGRNWRNLAVVVPVSLLAVANLWFHVSMLRQDATDAPLRLGFAVVIFLIAMIGGRIIPSFTRNWLVKANCVQLPTPFGGFDKIVILASAMTLGLWVVFPDLVWARSAMIAAAGLHLARLARWQGIRTWRSPLLLVLHLAYGFVPLGLLALGLGRMDMGLHLIGIGAIGGMTVSVMIRATLGHTGRNLSDGDGLAALCFGLLAVAGLIRAFATSSADWGLVTAAGLWFLCFALFLVRAGPWLMRAKQAARQPNKAG